MATFKENRIKRKKQKNKAKLKSRFSVVSDFGFITEFETFNIPLFLIEVDLTSFRPKEKGPDTIDLGSDDYQVVD